jgi:hypothetical protein
LAVHGLQAIGIVAGIEVLSGATARDQRVIPSFAMEVLRSAVPTDQAIGTVVATGTVAAIEELTAAPARDQRVIPGIAYEGLVRAVPTLQAIGIIAAPK